MKTVWGNRENSASKNETFILEIASRLLYLFHRVLLYVFSLIESKLQCQVVQVNQIKK